MKYKAVIFDLFGTLVPSFTDQEYREILRQMAEILAVPSRDFWVLWADTLAESVLGTIPSVESQIVRIGRQIGVKFPPAKVRAAQKLMSDYSARTMQPRPGAVEALSQLNQRGLKLGLISDCTSDTPELWKKTALAPLVDATVFSCLVGLRKPDQRIYRLAVQQLAVKPSECLYVGDGAGRELSGALEAGLNPVQLYIPAEKDAFRVDTEAWEGQTIASLSEILGLIDN
jgi:putative hydrolase of the HAD superfamily